MTAKNRASLEEAERQVRAIANAIGEAMPQGWGFILWLMSYGENGAATYISSLSRDTAILVLEEWIARQKTAPATNEFIDETSKCCWCCGHADATALITIRGPRRSVDLCTQCILRDG